MGLSAHLSFNGQCEEAFKMYEKLLGGKTVTMLTYGDSPMAGQVSPDWRGKICHASLSFTHYELAGADAPSPEQYSVPVGFYLIWGTEEPEDAERVFNGLAEGGDVRMPLQETFWSVRYGVVVDRFGIPWEINCEQAAVTTSGN